VTFTITITADDDLTELDGAGTGGGGL